MAKRTLAAVITEVVSANGKPMTAAQVYEKIVSGQLFEFQSKDPLGIVRNALSRHSVENQHSCASKNKCFSQQPDGRYRSSFPAARIDSTGSDPVLSPQEDFELVV